MNRRTARIDAYVFVSTRTSLDQCAHRTGRSRAHILEQALTEYLADGCPAPNPPLPPAVGQRPRIFAYILPEVREALDRAADETGRSLSHLVESALRQCSGDHAVS